LEFGQTISQIHQIGIGLKISIQVITVCADLLNFEKSKKDASVFFRQHKERVMATDKWKWCNDLGVIQ
jgi:hypothetical protein